MEHICDGFGTAPDWLWLSDDDPRPSPTRSPPEWTTTGLPNAPELLCVRRETPRPAVPPLE